MPAFDVLVIGRSCVDYLAIMEKFPQEDTKAPLIGQFIEAGGQGSTASCCIAKLGGTVAYLGRVGGDANGQICLQRLEDFGVETRWVKIIGESHTPVAYVWVSRANASRTIIYEPNCLPPLNMEDIPEKLLEQSGVILIDPQATAIAGKLKASLNTRISIVYDCERWLDGMEEVMEIADYFIPSRIFMETEELGLQDLSFVSQMRELKKRIKGELIVTRGEKGAYYCGEDHRIWHTPAPAVDVKDTTGAGDNFHAAFALGIGRGFLIHEAVKFSVAVASLSCRDFGGRKGIPSFAEAMQAAAEIDPVEIK
jgi:sulfofructose kinase